MPASSKDSHGSDTIRRTLQLIKRRTHLPPVVLVKKKEKKKERKERRNGKCSCFLRTLTSSQREKKRDGHANGTNTNYPLIRGGNCGFKIPAGSRQKLPRRSDKKKREKEQRA